MNIRFCEAAASAVILIFTGAALNAGWQIDGKAKQQQENCLSNVKALALSLHLYAGDYDDTFALSMERSNAGSWNVTSLTKSNRRDLSNVGWANAIYPYSQRRGYYVCPSAQRQGSDDRPDDDRGVESSYTYNGLMHAFNLNDVASPSDLPILWEGLGATYVSGHYASNPVLLCYDAAAPCVYNGNLGPAGVLYRPLGSMFIHGNGSVFGFADGHVAWISPVSLTELQTRRPKWVYDPFESYDEDGNPNNYWNEGLHPILFKPDSKFSDKQVAQSKPLAIISR